MAITDEQCFARVLAAFAGERFRLDGGASKVMRFMCHDRSGCDAMITPSKFKINFGWNYGPHGYYLRTAPGIVSWLLAATGTRGVHDVRAAIGPAKISSVAGFLAWQMPALHVGMWAEQHQILIRVRDTVAALASPLSVPVEEPRFAALPRRCRHCGQVPERYRVLRCGSHVCLACGRSQTVRAVHDDTS